MDPPSRRLGHLVAALSARADVESLTCVLTESLAEMLPAGVVRVDRDRSMSDRLHGRLGRAAVLTVRAGDKELILRSGPGGATGAEIAHTVRGVVLSRRQVTVADWIEALADEIDRLAAADEAARRSLDNFLLG